MKSCIIIPTYNERENIIPLIQELFTRMPNDVGVLVVDDGSPDGTGELVREYATTDHRVRLMSRAGKQGLGSAYRSAFREVLERGEDDVILTMDADFSHSPSSVPELIREIATHDLVVGSRYIPGGRIENWEVWRRVLSRGANWYVRLITGLPMKDCTTGFSAMRTDFLRRIPFAVIRASGYAWWFTLRMMFHRGNARIAEIPITFTDRRLGSSKLSGHIIYEGFIEPWRIRWSLD